MSPFVNLPVGLDALYHGGEFPGSGSLPPTAAGAATIVPQEVVQQLASKGHHQEADCGDKAKEDAPIVEDVPVPSL